MRRILFFSLLLAAATPAAAQSPADPWANLRVAQAGPHIIPGPQELPSRRNQTMRDYEPTPAAQGEFAGPSSALPFNDFGGGFIEFLFTGRTSGRYAAPSMPRSHFLLPPYEMERSVPYSGGPVIQARQGQPDAGAYPQSRGLDPRFLPQEVRYETNEKPGTIVIDSKARYLYLVEEGGMAKRYGVGVGRDGFGWSGVKTISAKKEWPDWRPPEEMLQRRPDLPRYMAGGPDNPLGARALYLGNSLYRIHGSNEPHTIGQAVSSGCFRMRNEDVIELYERVGVGTKVVVL